MREVLWVVAEEPGVVAEEPGFVEEELRVVAEEMRVVAEEPQGLLIQRSRGLLMRLLCNNPASFLYAKCRI